MCTNFPRFFCWDRSLGCFFDVFFAAVDICLTLAVNANPRGLWSSVDSAVTPVAAFQLTGSFDWVKNTRLGPCKAAAQLWNPVWNWAVLCSSLRWLFALKTLPLCPLPFPLSFFPSPYFVVPRLFFWKAQQTLETYQILVTGNDFPTTANGSPNFCVSASSLAGNCISISSVNLYYYWLYAVLSVIRTPVLNAWTQLCAKKNIDLVFWVWLNCSGVYSAWRSVLFWKSVLRI